MKLEEWDRKMYFCVVWQCSNSSFDWQHLLKRMTKIILKHLVSEDRKRRKKNTQTQSPIIAVFLSIFKYFLFVQPRKVHMLCKFAYGMESYKKPFRNNFNFLIIKLNIFKTYFKDDTILVAEESMGWRTQPSVTDQDKSKFPTKAHQTTKKLQPTPRNEKQNCFECCIVCLLWVGGSGRGGQYCTKKLAFKLKNTTH